ncbi:MAG TPA: carboxymuconolactone decarboxylase family protein [Mycobacterium sp.]|nr:carboxymuconolactone decarboxylase family protein [Mycobacterium sp.]
MMRYAKYSGRIAPASPPLPDDIQQAIDTLMRGAPPLVLFTTLARDPRLFFKMFDGGLLDRGNLTLRQREIVIDRVTANCRAEYEWGVHVNAFAAAAGLTTEQIRSLTVGDAGDDCWDAADRLLIRLCDSLHRYCDVDDELWTALTEIHSDETVMELLMLAGVYRMISYLVNGLRLPLEPGAPRFPDECHSTRRRPVTPALP